MAEFKAIGLVDKEHEGGGGNMQITLKDEFNWFLSEEFQKLRDGFKPADNSEYLNEGRVNEVVKVLPKRQQEARKEKIPPTTTNISLSTSTDNVDDYNNNGNKELAIEKLLARYMAI